MSLSDALQQQASRNYRMRCAIAVLLEQLNDTDAAVLAAALTARDAYTNGEIERALASEGHSHIKSYTIMRHRNGSCSCGPR